MELLAPGEERKSEFLLKEYELCFQQLRFYDERHSDTLRYLFGLASAVATALLAVYKAIGGSGLGFYTYQALLSGVVFVAASLLFVSMLQNRIYFVKVARQINAIRKYMLATEAPKFRDNQLYTSTEMRALQGSSTQVVELVGAGAMPAAFACMGVYSILAAAGCDECKIILGVVAGVLTGVGAGVGAVRYLSLQDRADLVGSTGGGANPEEV